MTRTLTVVARGPLGSVCAGSSGNNAEPLVAEDEPTHPDNLLALLTEWMAWWWVDDDAPAKLPKGLQVRTAVALTVAGIDFRPTD